MSALEARTLRAPGGGGAGLRALGRGGDLPSGARSRRRRDLLDRGAAAQRHRFASHGPTPERLDSGRVHPHRANARQAHQVDLRHRSRGDRDPAPGRAGASPRHYGRRSAASASSSACGAGGSATARRSPSSTSASERRSTTPTSASTIDEDLRPHGRIKVFVYLFEKGSSPATSTWSTGTLGCVPRSRTWRSTSARSEDTLYLIDYPLESGSGALTVATVRPETMLADTAIAVHPSDERYSPPGRRTRSCRSSNQLPIIADEHVDPAFGTGALKVTPGHDPSDFEIGRAPARRDHGDRRGRPYDRGGARGLSRHGDRGCTNGGGRRPARAGARLGHPAVPARRAPLAPLRAAHRAADLAAVVLRHEHADRAGHRGGARGPMRFHPGTPGPTST